VLVASVPIAIYLLGLSLRDETGFSQVTALFTRFAVKAAMLFMVWALAQHVLGGVRHLLTDFGIGSPLRVARRSAWFVNLAAVAVALFAAGALW
jgi:succinate dehydrogenase / fumarate reductase, cytochrome b subunit